MIPSRELITTYPKNLMLSYIGKGKKYGTCSRVPGSIGLDWEKSHEEYMILLKNSRFIFTWDPMSGVNLDAVTYGCMPVFLSTRPWSDNEIQNQDLRLPSLTIEEFGKESDVLKQFDMFLDKRDKFFIEIDGLQKQWPEKIYSLVKLIEQHFGK
jgi:hypothetical protein